MILTPRVAGALALTAALVVLSADARAHSQSRSFSIWTVTGGSVSLYVEVDAADVLESVWVDLNRDGALTPGEVAASQGRIAKLLDPFVAVAQAGQPCARTGTTSVQLAAPPDTLYLRAQWACHGAITKLKAALRLHEALKVASHRNLANFKLPKQRTAQHVFSPSAEEVALDVEQPPEETSALAAFRVYFLLGLEHILGGWDHLLFLAALLLIWPTIRQVLVIVTSFTLAHSVTLALATLDVVRPPEAVVEAVIAGSILYVAVENLLYAEAPRRWLLTFGFGLVHGFGFSGVLRELGLPQAHLVASLLAFNVGVEAGQLAVVLPAVALLTAGRRLPEATRRRITQALSIAVIVPAAWWLFERVLPH